MSQIESPPTTTEQVRSRMPHVIGVAAGIAILAGAILLWTGQPAEQAPQGHSALGSTLNLGLQTHSGAMPEQTDAATLDQSAKPAATVDDSPTTDGGSTAILRTDSSVEQTTAILGTWKQYSHGHRRLNVKPNGTATIDVKLDGLSAIAFGEKLRIDIAWEIKDQTLIFKTTGGTPEASLNAVKSIYGDNRIYTILEINEKQMLLREGEEDKTPWDRVAEE